MDDPNETKNKIVSVLKAKGPSLPVQIASQTGISSLFAGAFLSELAKEKAIKISNMKVGGSPLYYLPGQEPALDNFYQYLPGKEKEAFSLLKGNKILSDKKQHPAIRVALRSIKDFAIPFLKDQEIMWHFHTVSENEVRAALEPKRNASKVIKQQVKQEIKQPIKQEIRSANKQPRKKVEKQLDIGLEPAKIEKTKEKPDFAKNIIKILDQANLELIEEKEAKKKEFSAIIKLNTSIGKIRFLCVAKDKKRLNENDLKLILQKSQSLKMPSLILYTGEVGKKAQEYADSCDLLKLKKIQ